MRHLTSGRARRGVGRTTRPLPVPALPVAPGAAVPTTCLGFAPMVRATDEERREVVSAAEGHPGKIRVSPFTKHRW